MVAYRIPQNTRNCGDNGRREAKVYANFIYCGRNASLLLINIFRSASLDQQVCTRGAPGLLLSACTTQLFVDKGVKCLLVLVVEEVVCRVPLELSLTHSAGGSGGRSTLGVQTLDEGDICQEFASCWPLLISDGLQ